MLRIDCLTNGLKSLTKTPVVLDTMVLLRILSNKSPYVDILERIIEDCNKIMFSTPILREWITKSFKEGMSSSVILRKLEELRQIKKLKRCNKTSIDKARKLITARKCKKPTDSDDLKFVEVALSSKAILITKDRGLLDLNPYKCGKKHVVIIRPQKYLEITP